MMKMKWNLTASLLALLLLFNIGHAADAPQAAATAQPTADYQACPPGALGVPVTNAEIRFWYNQQVAVIPALNREWVADQLGARERAERAYKIRHNARINARYFMKDKEEVGMLRKRDQGKYGNPDGPTFEHLVEMNRAKGLADEAIFEAIVESSSRTSAEYNQRFGIQAR